MALAIRQFLGSNQRVGHSRLEGQCPTLAIGRWCRQVPMANSTVECREWGTGNHPRDGDTIKERTQITMVAATIRLHILVPQGVRLHARPSTRCARSAQNR